MRLFSAIPLLFWVGTAAVAHLAHVWALVPASVTPVAQAAETALGANPVASIFAAGGHLLPCPQAAPSHSWPDHTARITGPAPVLPEVSGTRLQHQILSAARLSGNPPPRRA